MIAKTEEEKIEELIEAIREGKRIKDIESLIKEILDINQKDKDGNTALTEAAAYGHAEYVKILLEHGAKIDEKNNNNNRNNGGNTALIEAAARGHVKCVEILLKKGADVNQANNDRDTALIMVAANRHAECVKILQVYGTKVLTDEKVTVDSTEHVKIIENNINQSGILSSFGRFFVTLIFPIGLIGIFFKNFREWYSVL